MRRIVSLFVAIATAVFLAACASSSTTHVANDSGTAYTGFYLPAPSTFRSVSEGEHDLCQFGAEYLSESGICRNTFVNDHVARFVPMWTDDSCALPQTAHVCYCFNVGEYSGDEKINFTFEQRGNKKNGWVAVSNYELNRWDWFQIPSIGGLEVDFTTHQSTEGMMHVVPLFTGTDVWLLSQLHIGNEKGLTINNVSPSMVSGFESDSINMSVDVTGEGPYTYCWDFGGASAVNASTEANPALVLGTQGSYQGSVMVKGADGVDYKEFNITINPNSMRPPVIESVSPVEEYQFENIILSVNLAQGEATSWHWEIEGLSPPMTTSEFEHPQIYLKGAVGIYQCSVTVTSPQGTDTFEFEFEIKECGS